MKKTETFQQLAASKNVNQLDALSRQMELLNQSKIRNAEELASILEPLAQAMAALTDETRETLEGIQAAAKQQNHQVTQQTLTTIQGCNSAAARAEAAANMLSKAGRRLELNHYLLALITGCMSALLVSAFWLWLRPPTIVNQLDIQELAEHLNTVTVPAKPLKGK